MRLLRREIKRLEKHHEDLHQKTMQSMSTMIAALQDKAMMLGQRAAGEWELVRFQQHNRRTIGNLQEENGHLEEQVNIAQGYLEAEQITSDQLRKEKKALEESVKSYPTEVRDLSEHIERLVAEKDERKASGEVETPAWEALEERDRKNALAVKRIRLMIAEQKGEDASGQEQPEGLEDAETEIARLSSQISLMKAGSEG